MASDASAQVSVSVKYEYCVYCKNYFESLVRVAKKSYISLFTEYDKVGHYRRLTGTGNVTAVRLNQCISSGQCSV